MYRTSPKSIFIIIECGSIKRLLSSDGGERHKNILYTDERNFSQLNYTKKNDKVYNHSTKAVSSGRKNTTWSSSCVSDSLVGRVLSRSHNCIVVKKEWKLQLSVLRYRHGSCCEIIILAIPFFKIF